MLTAELLATLAACRASDSCPPFCMGVASPAPADGAASSWDSTCACAGACNQYKGSIRHLPVLQSNKSLTMCLPLIRCRVLCSHVTGLGDDRYALPADDWARCPRSSREHANTL